MGAHGQYVHIMYVAGIFEESEIGNLPKLIEIEKLVSIEKQAFGVAKLRNFQIPVVWSDSCSLDHDISSKRLPKSVQEMISLRMVLSIISIRICNQ